jgi:dipeptidase E
MGMTGGRRQIVAIGGSGPATRALGLPLYREVLRLAGVDHPLVAYVGTASGDGAEQAGFMQWVVEALGGRFRPLSLFRPPTRDLRSYVLECSVVLVGGGNTRNLLVLWREWGLDTVLREAWDGGTVLAGSSAGGLCWFESGVTDSFGPGYEPLTGLGWLPGSFCPHWDGEAERQLRYRELLRQGTLPPGWAVDEQVGLYMVDRDVAQVWTVRPQAAAYRASADSVEPVPATLPTL